MNEPMMFAHTRVREVASGDVRAASEWQRSIVARDGVSAFEAWAELAKAIVAGTMRIERADAAPDRRPS